MSDDEEGRRLRSLLRAMADPGFYEHRPERVDVHETHISWVFVADDLAYKVKKPLVLPFLDYGTLGRRRRMCEEEVRLNRRLAPDYYLGVRALVERDGGGFAIGEEDDPGAIEYAVEMRAIPARRELDRLLCTGAASAADLEAVADRLARFHRGARPADEPAAAVDRLIEALGENLATIRSQGAGTIEPTRLDSSERFTWAYLEAGGRARLERRAAAGCVRDCHGDLRAEHVLVTDPVQVYDCVEFDRGLREIDVAADIAFLVMDLERLGGRPVARSFEAAYRAAGGDAGDGGLLEFLAAYRAWVRAKVALLGPDPDRDRARAIELHRLGHRLAWRARAPFVLCICGVAASGKSTLAAALAEASGLDVVDADSIRKRLAGLAPTERASPDEYSEEASLRTYRALGRDAAEAVARDGAVIVDATCRRRADRDALRAGLGPAAPTLLFARCEADAETLLERARSRESEPGRISDAGVDVVRDQIGSFEQLDEAGVGEWAAIDTEAAVPEQVAAVEALLDRALLGASEAGG